jgi:hypothetical protein
MNDNNSRISEMRINKQKQNPAPLVKMLSILDEEVM